MTKCCQSRENGLGRFWDWYGLLAPGEVVDRLGHDGLNPVTCRPSRASHLIKWGGCGWRLAAEAPRQRSPKLPRKESSSSKCFIKVQKQQPCCNKWHDPFPFLDLSNYSVSLSSDLSTWPPVASSCLRPWPFLVTLRHSYFSSRSTNLRFNAGLHELSSILFAQPWSSRFSPTQCCRPDHRKAAWSDLLKTSYWSWFYIW